MTARWFKSLPLPGIPDDGIILGDNGVHPQIPVYWLTAGLLSAATFLFASEPSPPATLRVRGVLQPLEEITLRSPIDAKVTAMHVEPGQAVDPDQILVELDASDLRQDLAQAAAGADQATAEAALAHSGAERVEKAETRLRTDLGLARSLLNRPEETAVEPGRRRGVSGHRVMRAPLRELADERAATAESQTKKALLDVRMKRSIIETLEENVEALESQARAARNTAEAVLQGYSTVSAPAAATISDCPVKPNERVSAGQPIVTLIETKRVMALLWIPVQHVADIHRGAPVSVRPAANRHRAWEGEISRISLEPHPRTGQYLAEVVLDNKDGHLQPGMLVDAEIGL